MSCEGSYRQRPLGWLVKGDSSDSVGKSQCLRSPKCALKPFSRVQVCLFKVLGLCKSMLGGFLQNGGHNALPYTCSLGTSNTYLHNFGSPLWVSGNPRRLSLAPINKDKCLSRITSENQLACHKRSCSGWLRRNVIFRIRHGCNVEKYHYLCCVEI